MASADAYRNEHEQGGAVLVCLACGAPLREPFTRVGSLRCGDCRSTNKPLDRKLVKDWRDHGAHLH